MWPQESWAQALARMEWERLLGGRAGAMLKTGSRIVSGSHSQTDFTSRISARTEEELQTSNTFPCARQGRERRCVEVRLTVTANPTDIAKSLRAWKNRGLPEDVPEGMEISETLVLRTEAPGMVPHGYEHTTRTTVTDQTGRKFDDVKTVRVVYTYPD
jgi:hypothetical protein